MGSTIPANNTTTIMDLPTTFVPAIAPIAIHPDRNTTVQDYPMMKVTVVVTAGLLGLAALAVAAEDIRLAQTLSPAEESENLDEDLNRREERIFAFYTTTSITRLATTTITALSTCLSVLTGTACTGRKKKSAFFNLDILEELASLPVELVGSQTDEDLESGSSQFSQNIVEGRNGKKLTIWSTNFTTLTITSTSYLAGTTVTASALCTAPGLTAGCFGKYTVLVLQMKVAAVVTVSLLAVAAVAVAEGSQDDLPPAEVDERLQSARREERIFAFFTTTSVKRLATTTITALSTCLSVVAAPSCSGRRRKSLFQDFEKLNVAVGDSGHLFGSQAEAEELLGPSPLRIVREVVNDREGKKLTVWSTFLSTLTLTSTSYVAGTTVTASALCAAPGVTSGCFG
ncbi:uncharacterized protein [Panulirus ornatus]|uniref:uncharacterized protein n=1 Tax=Panulirus ornatus TaxID=150431 RepID=UPI003A8B2F15